MSFYYRNNSKKTSKKKSYKLSYDSSFESNDDLSYSQDERSYSQGELSNSQDVDEIILSRDVSSRSTQNIHSMMAPNMDGDSDDDLSIVIQENKRDYPEHYNKEDIYTKKVKINSYIKQVERVEKDDGFMPNFDRSKTILDINVKDVEEFMREKKDINLSKIFAHFLVEKKYKTIFDILRNRKRRRVKEWFIKTMKIEKSGGMLSKDGKKRRTPGGVFFAIMQSESQ